MVIEPSILATHIKTLEANKDRIRDAREGARAKRNDAALYEMAVVLRTHNEAILAILQSMATDNAPAPGARDMQP